MPFHAVEQGAWLSSIAKGFGFPDFRTIRNQPQNAELRSRRPDPRVVSNVRVFRLVEVLSLSVIFATCGLGACRRKEATVTDGAPKPRVVECSINPRAVFVRTWTVLAANDVATSLTPIFPGRWPPAGEPVAVLYGYGDSPLPSGVERDEITSPSIRIEVPLGDPTATPRLVRLDGVRRLGVWTVNRTKAGAKIMEHAAEPLLEAICAGTLPPAAEAAQLRASYREWISVRGVLSGEMRRLAPAFFTWVEGDD